jgi:alpha-tubulin suppressor-like RCC1 family protein
MSLPSSVWCSSGWRIRPRPHGICDRCLAAAATREASGPVRRGGSARALGIYSIVLFGLLVVAHTVHAQGTPRIGGGDAFTCALGPSGRVFCWGSNSAGQIGIGAGMASPVTFEARPVEMAGGFKTIASGLFHSCGLQLDGTAYCWGSNANGQLGTNPSAAQAVSLPVRVETSAKFQAISAGGSILSSPPANGMLGDVPGSHTCALEVGTGRAFCWGLNFNGQLGQNPQLVRFTAVPSPVSLPSPGGTPLEFKAISAGGVHTCGIDLTGDAWCWGSNVEAKSGDVNRCGYTTNLSTPCFFDRPIMVTASRPPLAIKFVAISAGPRSTCAIDTAGAVRCWGSALRGAPLGRNETADMPSTVPINGTVVSVSVGESSACAATDTREVFCWGSDDKGQLGDGGPIPGTNSITPVRVGGPQDYVAVSVKQTQACGLTAAGVLRCWGGVDAIDIGVTGTRVVGTASPVSVDGVQASSVAVGGLHVCAVDSALVTSCWGGNASGQVGHGRNQTVPLISVVPTPVARYYVQRGPTVTPRPRPSLPPESLSSTRPFIKPTLRAEVATMSFSNLAVGGQHACAVAASGVAYCWGADGFGQIGNGNRTTAACRFGPGSPDTCVPAPTIVSRAAEDQFQEIVAGAAHNCARDSNQLVRCWGAAQFGELGSPVACASQPCFRRAPALVTLPQGTRPQMIAVSANDGNACTTGSGEVLCWGSLPGVRAGQILQTATAVSMQFPTGPNYVRVGAGGDFYCAGTPNGPLQCLGNNAFGQLGDGTNTASTTPALVSAAQFTSIALGRTFACGLGPGGVACWGSNRLGQLGDGTTGDSNVPTASSLAGFTPVSVGVGFQHACAIDVNGAAFCWGSNSDGQLGDGNANLGANGPVAVAAGWKIP